MLAEAIRQMTESLLENKGSTSGPQVRDDFKVMDELHKYKPAPFKGSPNPLDADNWLLEMEKRMELLEVEDRLRVKIATYYLQDAAGHWWTVTKTKEGMQKLTWNEFQGTFPPKVLSCGFEKCQDNGIHTVGSGEGGIVRFGV